jgi:3D (Asp-Asp-Asp) domain-containing protein
MYIVSNDGAYIYGIATAEDCGGAIGGARVDLYYDTKEECFAFGRRDCTIYFLA